MPVQNRRRDRELARSLRWLLQFIVLVFVLHAAAVQAAERVALVIGNSAYKNVAPLKNPKNDAESMAKALGGLGFEIVTGVDLDATALKNKVREFAHKLRGAKTALLFYAGHGLQVDGINYLAPTDALLETQTDLEFETVRLEFILSAMEGDERTSIVFLDACRDNPLVQNLARSMGKRSAALGRGLAPVETGFGTFVGFSTQPGNVALDGTGRHSPFTEGLLNHIETPGVDVEVLMRRVRDEVVASTGGKQVPWSNSSLLGQGFVFKAALPQPESAPPVAPPPAARGQATDEAMFEVTYWGSIKDAKNPKLFKAYLAKYPNGQFADLAKLMLEGFEAKEKGLARVVPPAVTPTEGFEVKESKDPKEPKKAPEPPAAAAPQAVLQPPAEPQAPAPTVAETEAARELAYWNTVKDSKNPKLLRAYLAKFPGGTFVDEAKALLEAAERAKKPTLKPAAEPPKRRVEEPPPPAPKRVQKPRTVFVPPRRNEPRQAPAVEECGYCCALLAPSACTIRMCGSAYRHCMKFYRWQ